MFQEIINKLIEKYSKPVIILLIIGVVISIFVLAPYTVAMKQAGSLIAVSEFKFSIGNIFGAFEADNIAVYKQTVGIFWFLYVLAIIIIALKTRFKGEYDEIEHGSSDWAKYGEQYTIMSKDSGIIMAEKNYLPLNKMGNLNVLIAGGSGSGKSAAYVIPNSFQLLGSYVFTDPKGEIYDRTAGYFKKNGYKIKTLNLVKPEYSDSYNPLEHIRNEIDVDIIANTIVKGQGDGKGSDPYWEDMAEVLLKSLIYYLMATRPIEEQSLASCANLVRAANNNGSENLLTKLMSQLPQDHPARINYKSIEIAPEKTFGSILSTLQSKLGKFDSKEIQGVTSSNTINFEDLGNERVALYVIPPDSHSAYNFLLTIFFAQMIQQLYDFADSNGGKLKNLVLFMLDEFANIGKIPDFEKKISTSRSRNISFSVIVQTLDQLTDLYKDAAETIMANCDTHLFLGGNSLKTAEHFSKALGEKTIKRDNISTSKDKDNVKSGKSFSDQIMARPLMTADEIRRLDPSYALVLVKGIKPVKEKKYMYFKKPIYKITKECEVSHNDATHVERNEFRIYNPLAEEEQKQQVGKKPRTIDGVNFDKSDNKPSNSEPINLSFEDEDIPQVISSKKKKTQDEYNYDVQKELEAKFDELFGSSDSDED